MLGHFVDQVLGADRFQRLAEGFARRKAGLPGYVAEVIEAAHVMVRSTTEDGPIVFVTLGGPMRGAFHYTAQDAAERIRKRWPELTKAQLERAASFLEARVRLAASPARKVRRKTWVMDY